MASLNNETEVNENQQKKKVVANKGEIKKFMQKK